MKNHFYSLFVSAFLIAPVYAEIGFRADGVTEPLVDAILSPMVRGMVARIVVQEGETVKKGEVVIELRKKLEELDVARRKIVWESRLELKAAEARLDTVKQDLESTRRLYHTTKSISKERLLEKELNYKLAMAEAERLEVAEDLQKLEYEMAQEQLELREIRSPFNGVVSKIFRQAGESAEPGQPLVRIVDTKTCLFITNIEAKLARTLKEGEKVRLEIEAGKSPIIIEGITSFVSPVVDPASGLQEIKIMFDNSSGEIRPGVAGVMITGGN